MGSDKKPSTPATPTVSTRLNAWNAPVDEVTHDGAITVFAFYTYTLRPFQRQPNMEHPYVPFCSSLLLRKPQRGTRKNCRGLADKASRAVSADRR
jgi:hypothetical protein